ncbi:MAG TPA: alanine racemase [Verrucomicrobiae bacterium]|nr:alanine racemase [Verrucomicrobiae bacterium]
MTTNQRAGFRMSLGALADLVSGALSPGSPADAAIDSVTIDSRHSMPGSLFVALEGARADGHAYAMDAARNGAAAALVRREHGLPAGFPIPLVAVDSPLLALQRLAGDYRDRLPGTVVAITGSNGKTEVKDILATMLAPEMRAYASPGSYNSQIGVPLAILRAPSDAAVCVFEAGVSAPGEMPILARMLRPTHGVLTNIGRAHLANFTDRTHLLLEKLTLFDGIAAPGWIAVGDLDEEFERHLSRLPTLRVTSRPAAEPPWLSYSEHDTSGGARVAGTFGSGRTIEIAIPARSPERVANLMLAAAVAHALGVSLDVVERVLGTYTPLPTRLEIWDTQAGVTVVNDGCSADPLSVQVALKTTSGVARRGSRKVFVFGGMESPGGASASEHLVVGRLAHQFGFERLVCLGDNPGLAVTASEFTRLAPAARVDTIADVELHDFLQRELKPGDAVLFKAARSARFHRRAAEALDVLSPTRLIVDLGAVQENLTRIRRLCGPGVRTMAMVKALAYGTDVRRLAGWLQDTGIDAFGVAFVDEGVALRASGVHLPILVHLPQPQDCEKAMRDSLDLAVYSREMAGAVAESARDAGREVRVHLKIDTGLHRLGIAPAEIPEIAAILSAEGRVRVVGVLTHFAAAEDPGSDLFTEMQIASFAGAADSVRSRFGAGVLRHAAATSGAIRFPHARFDMVRIGLGLYGIHPGDAVADALPLELAVTLRSRIADVRLVPTGEWVGYGRTFRAARPTLRGTVPIGFHDALPLALSNRGHALVNDTRAPIIGRVSMDSVALDLTDVPGARVGSDAVFYGRAGKSQIRPEQVAAAAGTTPYELLTRLGPRVQRVYLGE